MLAQELLQTKVMKLLRRVVRVGVRTHAMIAKKVTH